MCTELHECIVCGDAWYLVDDQCILWEEDRCLIACTFHSAEEVGQALVGWGKSGVTVS